MFPAALRLTKKDFSTIKTKLVYRGEFFDIAKHETLPFKVSCVISKKRIHKAVERNRVRRRFLNALRLYIDNHPNKGFFIFYPKPNSKDATYQKIEEEIFKAFATLG